MNSGRRRLMYSSCTDARPSSRLQKAASSSSSSSHHEVRSQYRNPNNVPSTEKDKKFGPSSNRRYWFPKNKSQGSCSSGFTFTVMSYNILSDELLKRHPELYVGCKKRDLDWNNRWGRILEEIRRINPDVLALQEAQNDHYGKNIYPDLKQLAYEGHYKKRTGSKNSDGLALFYKTSKLKLVNVSSVELNQNRISLDRDNVAIIGHFRNHENKGFILATTHLLFNPKRSNIRLAQSALLLAEIQRLSYVSPTQYLPIIVTGDFNSEPCSSVHRFWMSGRVKLEDSTSFCLRSIGLTSNCLHEHIKKDPPENNLSSTQNKSPYLIDRSANAHSPLCVPFNPYESYFGEMRHCFNFHSTETFDSKGITSKQDVGWCRVDYMLFSSQNPNNIAKNQSRGLRLSEVLRSPLSKDMKGVRIPSKTFPSDHISQVAKFILL